MTQSVNETKCWFFEKTSKIDKSSAKLTKRKRKIQINKIRDEKGDISTNTNDIWRIIRKYFENLYSNKVESLEEMDKFLDAYNFSKLNQEDINHLNRSKSSNEIETVMESLPTKKKTMTRQDSFPNSTRYLRKS
jgi:hypothetical protein